MSLSIKEIQDYVYENKSLVLATVCPGGRPHVRHIGAYTIDGKDIYFNTIKGSTKTEDIAAQPRVALLFQHEGQQVPKNITFYGDAAPLDKEETAKALELIKKRRPQVQYNEETNVIYKVTVDRIKILDFTAEEKQVVLEKDDIEKSL